MHNSAQLSVKLYWWPFPTTKILYSLQTSLHMLIWTVEYLLYSCFKRLSSNSQSFGSLDCCHHKDFCLFYWNVLESYKDYTDQWIAWCCCLHPLFKNFWKHFSVFLILFNKELQCLCCYSIFPNNIIKKWWVKWIFSITLENLGAWGTVNKKFLCCRDKHGITYWKE